MKTLVPFQSRTARSVRRSQFTVLAALLMLASISSTAFADNLRYRQTNLVSDQPGVAQLQDPDLVNSWGLASGATGPFWVSDNGTGVSTVYEVTRDSSGKDHVTKRDLTVTIPGEGNPTGVVTNDSPTDFNGDRFIFVSEDGTISGWRPELGTAAEVLTTRTGAVYKGATLATGHQGILLLAANFSEGTVDAYDSTMQLVARFTDHNAPAGYAPFNVQNTEGHIFVTFAKQDADKMDDVPGPGHGLIDVLDTFTESFHRVATGTDAGGDLNAIDSPWGIAVATHPFGNAPGQLLVGNFGSGTIMAFDFRNMFRGLLKARDNTPLVIDGLWALRRGNGGEAGDPNSIYFTAGPDGENHGLFGRLQPAPGNGNAFGGGIPSH